MEETYKISVIIPVYNIAEHIAACLDSVLRQTYTNLEIICIDDGSVDSSGDVLDTYMRVDSRIHVIHKSNGGVAKARVDGILAATGDFIGFVDGDDVIDETMYELLLSNMIKEKADISHCGYRLICLDRSERFFYNTKVRKCQDRIDGLTDLISGKIEPGLCNKLFKSDLIKDVARSCHNVLDFRINEDLLMNFYAFSRAERSIHEDVCLYYYMLRKDSASTSAINLHRVVDPLAIKELIVEECAHTAMEDVAKAARINTYIDIYNTLMGVTDPELTSHCVEIRKKLKMYRADVRLLSRQRRLLRQMILYAPFIYSRIYRVFR